jgi:hypothetical protein
MRRTGGIAFVALVLASCSTPGGEIAPPTGGGISPRTAAETTLPPEAESTEDAFEAAIIPSGVYVVGDEIKAGLYRVTGYWARLDEDQEIIDNDVMGGDDGLLLLKVSKTDAYVEISGEAIPLSFLPEVDALDYTEGTYLVGVDIKAGRYKITPVEGGGGTYWARLDKNFELIDNNVSDGQLIAIVKSTDYAFTFTGEVRRLG